LINNYIDSFVLEENSNNPLSRRLKNYSSNILINDRKETHYIYHSNTINQRQVILANVDKNSTVLINGEEVNEIVHREANKIVYVGYIEASNGYINNIEIRVISEIKPYVSILKK
jgi:hypothetical protein